MGFWSDFFGGIGAIGKWLRHEHPANDVDTSGEGKPASGDSTSASGDSTSASGDSTSASGDSTRHSRRDP